MLIRGGKGNVAYTRLEVDRLVTLDKNRSTDINFAQTFCIIYNRKGLEE